jgi:hypothetical protein
VFSEIVSEQAGRAEQWKKIVAAGANGRNCHVFHNKVEFMNSGFYRGMMQGVERLSEVFLAKLEEMGITVPPSGGSSSVFTIRDVRPPGLPPASLN